MVAALVVLELFCTLLFFGRQNDAEGKRFGVEQGVIAGLGLQRFDCVGKFLARKDLERFGLRCRSGSARSKEELLCKRKANGGDERRRPQEVASSSIFGHAEVNHIRSHSAKSAFHLHRF